MTRDPDAAEDLVQTALLRGWTYRAQYDPDRALSVWLRAILRNAAVDASRPAARRPPMLSLDCLARDDCSEPFTPLQIPAPPDRYCWEDAPDPDDALLAALDGLCPPYRAVLLARAEGASYQRMSELCGCPVNTVRSRLHRARVRLAARLEPAERARLSAGRRL